MAYGYWKLGKADQQAAFHLSFRRSPFGGGFSIACGMYDASEYLSGLRIDDEDLAYLADLSGNDDRPLFDHGFLDHAKTPRCQEERERRREKIVFFVSSLPLASWRSSSAAIGGIAYGSTDPHRHSERFPPRRRAGGAEGGTRWSR